MPRVDKIKIRKEEGRNVHFYDVYTADYIDRILGGGGASTSGSGGSRPDPSDPTSGIGTKIGIITEDLAGEVSEFDVKLKSAISAGRDYVVVNQEFEIFSFTPNADVQVGDGTVTLGTDTQIINALSGSPIYEQGAQQEAENREFRERITSAETNLTDLNDNVLPEVNNKLETLDGYFEDPNTIPDNFEFFEGIVSNEVWAQTGVFMEAWFDQAFGNSLMVNRVTSNIIDTADLAASTAFIQKLFAQEIALVLDTSVSPNKGGLLRSTNWDGTLSTSNLITGNGTTGWAVDYNGTAVFHTIFARGTMQSDNFVTGVSGWQILNTGDAEFDNVIARGEFIGLHDGSVASGDNLQSSNFVTGVSGWRIQGSGDVEFQDGLFRGEIFITGGNASKTEDTTIIIPYTHTGDSSDLSSLPTTRPNGDPLLEGDSAIPFSGGGPTRFYDGTTPYTTAGWSIFDKFNTDKPVVIRANGPTGPTNRGSAYGNAPLENGDIWLETDQGDKPYSWNGSAWIRQYTIIDGGDLITGTVTANKIDVDDLFAQNITITGQLTNSGSDFFIDGDGIRFDVTGFGTANGARWVDGATTYGEIYSTAALGFVFEARNGRDARIGSISGADVIVDSANDVTILATNNISLNPNGRLDMSPTSYVNAIAPLKLQSRTTTQMNAISPAIAGMVIYNTTLNRIAHYDGSAWRQVQTSAI